MPIALVHAISRGLQVVIVCDAHGLLTTQVAMLFEIISLLLIIPIRLQSHRLIQARAIRRKHRFSRRHIAAKRDLPLQPQQRLVVATGLLDLLPAYQ